ncbi:hypothetical protein WR25_03575 [Diploscapter pachys]|uniref:Uncharacterized protein n=1 Tax=Diploscapter pachys TaxID=2018661 RepID=A0A2A2K2U8_9BILA|nr:hypothetical protein WR25_03575 [Diploscapter pachys]
MPAACHLPLAGEDHATPQRSALQPRAGHLGAHLLRRILEQRHHRRIARIAHRIVARRQAGEIVRLVGVCALVDERARNAFVAGVHRQDQRRLARRIGEIRVRLEHQQQVDQIVASGHHRQRQRRIALGIADVGIGLMLQQILHVEIARMARQVVQRAAAGGGRFGVDDRAARRFDHRGDGLAVLLLDRLQEFVAFGLLLRGGGGDHGGGEAEGEQERAADHRRSLGQDLRAHR